MCVYTVMFNSRVTWIHSIKVITKKVTNTSLLFTLSTSGIKSSLQLILFQSGLCTDGPLFECVAGGDQQRHSRNLAMHRLRVWSVHQRARSPAPHLQTAEGLSARLTDATVPQRPLPAAARTSCASARVAVDTEGKWLANTPQRHKQRKCRNRKSECHDIWIFFFFFLYNGNCTSRTHEKVFWFSLSHLILA